MDLINQSLIFFSFTAYMLCQTRNYKSLMVLVVPASKFKHYLDVLLFLITKIDCSWFPCYRHIPIRQKKKVIFFIRCFWPSLTIELVVCIKAHIVRCFLINLLIILWALLSAYICFGWRCEIIKFNGFSSKCRTCNYLDVLLF
jgi:hypothetical protein